MGSGPPPSPLWWNEKERLNGLAYRWPYWDSRISRRRVWPLAHDAAEPIVAVGEQSVHLVFAMLSSGGGGGMALKIIVGRHSGPDATMVDRATDYTVI